MILHLVVFAPKDGQQEELARVMQGLAELVGKVDGYVGFEHGPNIDAEGKSPNYPYGFVCRFAGRAALDAYATDPRHQALGGRLVALTKGGGDGIMVYDIDTGEAAP